MAMGLGFGTAAIIILLLVVMSFRVLREYERAVVFMLGRFWKVKGPGFFLLIPGVQPAAGLALRPLGLTANGPQHPDAIAVLLTHSSNLASTRHSAHDPVAHRHGHHRVCGKEDIHPRAELHHAEPIARAHRIARLDATHDSPCQHAHDLPNHDVMPVPLDRDLGARSDPQRRPDRPAGSDPDDTPLGNPPVHRHPVHVDVHRRQKDA